MTIEKQFIKERVKIQSYLYHKTGKKRELSEDLFQELYIKVRKIEEKGKYGEEGKFLNFIKRIASNMVIDHHRGKSKLKVISVDSFVNDGQTQSNNDFIFDLAKLKRKELEDEEYVDTFVSSEMKERLEDAINQLPEAQRELINQRYYRNMSYKEIVLETGEKQENLLPRMFHAKKNLKKILSYE